VCYDPLWEIGGGVQAHWIYSCLFLSIFCLPARAAENETSSNASACAVLTGRPAFRVDFDVRVRLGSGVVSIGIHDPFGHFKDSKGNLFHDEEALQPLNLDINIQEMLLAVARLMADKKTAKITVEGFDTKTEDVERMSVEGKPVDIYFDYLHPDHTRYLDDPDEPEPPIMALVGGVGEVLVRHLREIYHDIFLKTVNELALSAQKKYPLTLVELHRQFEILLSERLVWECKRNFYALVRRTYPYVFTEFWHDIVYKSALELIGALENFERYRITPGLGKYALESHVPDMDLAWTNPLAKARPH
jgi:hypothetical protein